MKHTTGNSTTSIGRGFTLVELLVVIGIISVLVAILLPSLGKARRSAARTVCLSNLRQIGIGIVNYQVDSKGVLPNAMSSTAATSDEQRRRWYGPRSIGKYWGVTEQNFGTYTPKILICPENEQRIFFFGQPTYTMNIEVMGGMTNSTSNRYRPGPGANQVHYKSTYWRKNHEKVVLIDGKPNGSGNTYAAQWYYLWNNPPDGNADMRHNAGINALFLDGHSAHFTKIKNDWRYNMYTGRVDQLVGANFQGEYNSSWNALRIGKLAGD